LDQLEFGEMVVSIAFDTGLELLDPSGLAAVTCSL
jgi:hypothetical protein